MIMKNVKTLSLSLSLCLLSLTSCSKNFGPESKKADLAPGLTNVALASSATYFSNIKYQSTSKFTIRQSTEYVTDGNRLRTALSYSDFDPTGLKPIAGTALQVQVTFHGGSTVKPVLIVGTPELDTEQTYTLNAGLNTLNPTLIKNMYLQYVSATPNTNDSVTVEFISGYAQVPLFKLGQTTAAEWADQLTTFSDAEYVTLTGQKNYILLTRSRYNNYTSTDPNTVLAAVDLIISRENEISGLDNSSTLHREPDGKVCIIEKNSGYMDATHKGLVRLTGAAAWDKVFKAKNIVSGSTVDQWGLWHEIGHLHQLWPITPYTALGEAAPNIYASYTKKYYEPTYRYVSGTNWMNAKVYLAQPDAAKNLAAAENYTKLMMFEQLMLAFGEDFMKNLHKMVREEIGITYPLPNRNTTNVDERLGALAFYASKTSGKNLTNFFQKWGFNLSSSRIALISALNLPEPATDVSLINSDDALIEGAYYSLNSKLNQNTVLTVKNGATANGTVIELMDNATLNNSKLWLVRKANATEYNFKSKLDTSKVMAVAAAGTANGTQVRIWTYDNGPAQRWTANSRGTSTFSFTPACAPSSRLDVNGGSTANGTKIQIWATSSTDKQDFVPVIQF